MIFKSSKIIDRSFFVVVLAFFLRRSVYRGAPLALFWSAPAGATFRIGGSDGRSGVMPRSYASYTVTSSSLYTPNKCWESFSAAAASMNPLQRSYGWYANSCSMLLYFLLNSNDFSIRYDALHPWLCSCAAALPLR